MLTDMTTVSSQKCWSDRKGQDDRKKWEEKKLKEGRIGRSKTDRERKNRRNGKK